MRLKADKEREEEQRKHAEKERDNLKMAKEMIEKELIALIEDSKKYLLSCLVFASSCFLITSNLLECDWKSQACRRTESF